MRLVTPAEMRLVERRAETDFGLSSILLMENAGARAAEVAVRMRSGSAGRVVVVAGKGANGGDGFVLARHLAGRGETVDVFLLGRETELRGDALTNFLILKKMAENNAVTVRTVTDDSGLAMLERSLERASLVVDALFGTGLRGSITGLPLGAITLINRAGRPVLSLDVPSGVDAGTGQLLAADTAAQVVHPGEAAAGAVRATVTVTFGLPKLGLFLYPGAVFTGELRVVDIGLPPSLLADPALKMHLITPDEVRAALPLRPVDAHKGSFGHALLVGGSPGLTGAVALAGEAALRMGAGKVTVAVPRSLNPILEVKLTEVMSLPLAETEAQTIEAGAAEPLLAWAGRCQAVGLGGGMGTDEGGGDFLRDFLAGLNLPVVLDADALRLMAARPELFREILAGRRQPAVLTPHPGEMAALMSLPVDAVERYRVDAAREVAQSWRSVLVLKGAHTVIATPDGELFLNPTGNPGLATGGTGDVLTGAITSLLAQGMTPVRAAVAGVYLHGLAGDLAAKERGPVGMAASDVVRQLPRAIQRVLSGEPAAGEQEE
ncbi:MAG: NAD(P)H-hydrate dehydratase [Bacillota bacterium]|nr:NAD(P)H-hydrate dehydratase [Bacillota bacterium]